MFIYTLMSKLPLWLLYRFADLFYFIGYYLIPYRKNVVRMNLKNAFPQKTDAEITQIVKQFYRHFTDILVEVIKMPALSEAEIKKRITLNNPELLQNYIDNKQSIILVGAHQGNWEWLSLAYCVHLPFSIYALYKPLKDKKVNASMLKQRSRLGVRLVNSHNISALRHCLNADLKAISLLADQTSSRESDKYWTRCLHQDTPFAFGLEKIAKLSQYPIIYFHMRRTTKRGFYTVDFELLKAPPHAKEGHEIIERYSQFFEKTIKAEPYNWLWSNRKWKNKKKPTVVAE